MFTRKWGSAERYSRSQKPADRYGGRYCLSLPPSQADGTGPALLFFRKPVWAAMRAAAVAKAFEGQHYQRLQVGRAEHPFKAFSKLTS